MNTEFPACMYTMHGEPCGYHYHILVTPIFSLSFSHYVVRLDNTQK